MKKTLLILILLTAAISTYLIIHHQPTTQSSKPTIKIGVSLPLTGEISVIGLANKGAVEIADKHIKAMNTKYNYEFIFDDNAYTISRTQNSATKLITIDKVDALLDIGSTSGKVVSMLAEKNNIIHLNTLSSDNDVAKGKYNFVNWTSPQSEAKKMLEIIKKNEYQNIAIFDINDAGVIAITDALEAIFKQNNIKYSVTRVNTGSKDLRIEIEKSQKDKPDLYIVTLHSPEIYVFIKQLREAGVTTDVTSIEAFTFFENLTPFEGVLYVDAAEGNSPVIDEIIEHNASYNTFGISNTYDNTMLLVQAFETAATKKQAVDELIQIKEYNGVTGHLIQDENGIFQSEAIIKKVINGKPVVVKE